jgi:hypothetical protein
MRPAVFTLRIRVRDVRQNQSYSEAIQRHFCAMRFIGLAAGNDKRQICIVNPAIRFILAFKNTLGNHWLLNSDALRGEVL